MDVSNFAKQMMVSSGISRLMEDLAGALATPDETDRWLADYIAKRKRQRERGDLES